MQKSQFLKNLANTYTGSNQTIIDNIGSFIDRCQINEFQLSTLYESILENYNYKTFPTLAEIKKHWEKIYKDPVPETCSEIFKQRESSKHWNIKQIIIEVGRLRLKNKLQSHEIDFCHQWNSLWGEFQIMKHKEIFGEPMKNHLEYIKSCIIKNENYKSIGEPVEVFEEEKRQERIVPIFECLKYF